MDFQVRLEMLGKSRVRAFSKSKMRPSIQSAHGGLLRSAGETMPTPPLVMQNGRYELDLEGLAASLTGNEKMMIFCSPHNPGGRIWTQDELRAAIMNFKKKK